MSIVLPSPPVSVPYREPGRAGHQALARATSSAWLPLLAVVGAIGLLVIAIADGQSRAGEQRAELLFWLGMLTLVVPVTARLACAGPTRWERIGLVTLLGLGLYLVKVMHSPVAFTFPDELVQLYNTDQILDNSALFTPNSILPVTPYYPGISLVAAVLGKLTGLGTFGVALVLMAAARLVLVWGLFLLHEQVGGSSRVAGLASALYAANPNFVFVGAGFIYESLALPIAVMALYAAARRADQGTVSGRIVLTLVAIVSIMTVAVTHHVTSWALVVCLLTVAALASVRRWVFPTARATRQRPYTWGLGFLCGVVILAWLVYVATATVGYLSPVFRGALFAVVRLIFQEETGRQVFQSAQTGQVAPLAERVLGVGAVLLIVLGLPFGLWQIVLRLRTNPFAITLAGAALLYFPMLGLRLTSAGWETGHRSSEFLYIGISLVLALGLVRIPVPFRTGPLVPLVVASYVAVIFAGGLIAGFPRSLRLPPPYATTAANSVIEPEGVVAARWTETALGSGRRFAASNADANLLLAYGDQEALWGSNLGIQSMFFASDLNPSVLDILRTAKVQYLFTNRRRISWDLMFGVYVKSAAESTDPNARYLAPEAITKFENVNGSSRIFDSGNIVIYDVGGEQRRGTP
jgi:hypothetical protein